MTDPDTKFNKIYMFIGNGITIVSGIFAFISWIVRGVSKTTDIIPDTVIRFLSYAFNFCIIVFIIALIYLFIRIIYVAIRIKSEALYMQRKISEFLHINLIHSIRNNIVELEPVLEKLEKYKKTNNIDAMDECYNKPYVIIS